MKQLVSVIKQVNIDVNSELWKQAKAKAALEEITMVELIDQLLKNYVGSKPCS